MAMTLQNPLAWAQFRLRGGTKMMLAIAGGYTVLVIGVMFLTLRADPKEIKEILSYWCYAFLALQAGALLLFGGNVLRNAIRKDITTKMIESHRLMPLTPTQAIFGYLAGTLPPYLLVGAVNVFLGSMTAVISGFSVPNFLIANAVLGIFAVAFWIVMIASAFMGAALNAMLWSLLMASWFSGGAAILVLPGLMVVTGPLVGKTIFGTVSIPPGISGWNYAYQVSSIAELCVGGFFLLAAIRKYRREDVLAFTPRMGLLMIAGWLVLSALGIEHFDEFRIRAAGIRLTNDLTLQNVGTIVSAWLLGLLPVSAAAWERQDWERRRRKNDIALGRRPLPPEAFALSAASFIALFAFTRSQQEWPYLAMCVASSSLAFLLAATYVVSIIYRGNGKPGTVVGVFIILTWGVPIGLDVLRFATSGDIDAPVDTWITSLSPPGAVFQVLRDRNNLPLVGLLAHWIPALVLAMLYYGRSTAKRSPVTPQPPLSHEVRDR